jgi:hypothetical protein
MFSAIVSSHHAISRRKMDQSPTRERLRVKSIPHVFLSGKQAGYRKMDAQH